MRQNLVTAFGVLVMAGAWLGEAPAQDSRHLYAAQENRPRRYNMDQVPYYRHSEDVRRYNAAPDRFGCQGYAMAPHVTATPLCPASCQEQETAAAPVKLRTVLVSRQTQPVSSYNACGSRISRTMVTTLYKDVYSDGHSRIWQHISISDE